MNPTTDRYHVTLDGTTDPRGGSSAMPSPRPAEGVKDPWIIPRYSPMPCKCPRCPAPPMMERSAVGLWIAIDDHIKEINALRARAEQAESQRDNLLARIHRDGGHYIATHGLEKALEDAHTITSKRVGDLEQAEQDRDVLAAEVLAFAQNFWLEYGSPGTTWKNVVEERCKDGTLDALSRAGGGA